MSFSHLHQRSPSCGAHPCHTRQRQRLIYLHGIPDICPDSLRAKNAHSSPDYYAMTFPGVVYLQAVHLCVRYTCRTYMQNLCHHHRLKNWHCLFWYMCRYYSEREPEDMTLPMFHSDYFQL